jgi:hypothetical protein
LVIDTPEGRTAILIDNSPIKASLDNPEIIRAQNGKLPPLSPAFFPMNRYYDIYNNPKKNFRIQDNNALAVSLETFMSGPAIGVNFGPEIIKYIEAGTNRKYVIAQSGPNKGMNIPIELKTKSARSKLFLDSLDRTLERIQNSKNDNLDYNMTRPSNRNPILPNAPRISGSRSQLPENLSI